MPTEAGARASFLLSIPATAAAGFYQLFKERKGLTGDVLAPTLVATVVAFIVGYACIAAFITIVKRRGIAPFVLYRFALAAILSGLLLSGKLDPMAGLHLEEPTVSARVP